MPSPFPGMDPYLEEPAIWPDVHARLGIALAETLLPLLRPRYHVSVELRVYEMPLTEDSLIAIGDVTIAQKRRLDTPTNGAGHHSSGPETAHEHEEASRRPGVLTVNLPRMVEVREHYLEIRRVDTREVITVIEVLSPTNKRPGKGRQLYEDKRADISTSRTNLIEIDLLRGGTPLPLRANGQFVDPATTGDYRVLVTRGHRRHRGDLYVIGVRDPLPSIPIPLRPEDAEPAVDLQAILAGIYDRGGYDLIVDYRDDPVPPLEGDSATWADGLLRQHGLRRSGPIPATGQRVAGTPA